MNPAYSPLKINLRPLKCQYVALSQPGGQSESGQFCLMFWERSEKSVGLFPCKPPNSSFRLLEQLDGWNALNHPPFDRLFQYRPDERKIAVYRSGRRLLLFFLQDNPIDQGSVDF